MMPEPIKPLNILVQPWFSDSGHPATYLKSIYLNVKTLVKPFVIIYKTPEKSTELPETSKVFKYSAVVTAPVLFQVLFKTLFTGTIFTLSHLRKKAKTIQLKAFYADVDLFAISLFLFPWPKKLLQLTAMVLVGPEHFQQGRILNRIKWPFVRRVFSNPKFFLCLRTPQLADAWKKALPHAKNRIKYAPSIELVGKQKPSLKLETSQKVIPRFLLSGQIRSEKSTQTILNIFQSRPTLGKLSIIGPFIGKPFKEIPKTKNKLLDIRNQNLTESQLIGLLTESHYNLMLYHPWDERMESAMLFSSIAAGCPVICFSQGWLGKQVQTFKLGWTVTGKDQSSCTRILESCPHPSLSEYQRVKRNIYHCFRLWSDPSRSEKFAKKVGWTISQVGKG